MRKYDMKDKSIKSIIVRYFTVTHLHEKQKNMRRVLHGRFGLVSELGPYLTRLLLCQRNRTPVEYEAACSAHFNPSFSTVHLTSHPCLHCWPSSIQLLNSTSF
ncbi:unnamed protein product [Pleuronectes platessa]|uniref:Uncharacterized protein n=1 Tax=Pleuronectes platessa TaxID=8262 RepID=A0A9N7UKV8_PLEPL|nr:unnamed protein product [Pleuronectes platessa]